MSKNYLRPTNYQWTPCVIMPAGRASYINRYGNEVIDYFDPITGIILQRVIVVPVCVQPPLPLPVVDVLTNADSSHVASSPTVIGETAHIPTGTAGAAVNKMLISK